MRTERFMEQRPAHLIRTSLKVLSRSFIPFNRFNGLAGKAVETAQKVFVTAATSLKRGVNEKDVLVLETSPGYPAHDSFALK